MRARIGKIAIALVIAVGLAGATGCRRRQPADTPGAPAATAGGAQYDAYARAMGYPARHDATELEAFLAQHLDGYAPVEGTQVGGQLEAAQPIAVPLERGRCYMMVLKLAPEASYSAQAEAGISFVFEPNGGGATVNGGPGIHGPGGVGSAGCPQSDDTYTFAMAPIVGGAGSLGEGGYTIELWSRPIDDAQLAALAADQQQQIAEADAFRAQREAEEAARTEQGCSRCAARYEGCIGAGRSTGTCQEEYRSCAFREAGTGYVSACPSP